MNEEKSRHFARLWEFITRSVENAYSECDSMFLEQCSVKRKSKSEWKRAVEKSYRDLRAKLEYECYAEIVHDRMLDPRKTAALICCALIQEKSLQFNEDLAIEFLGKKQATVEKGNVSSRLELNHWIVDNFFVNYKIAYLSGLRIVFETLRGELLSDPSTVDYGRRLSELGRMQRYPCQSTVDNFDVNLVLGLGRADILRKDINTFFLASQFYQIEMYTRLALGVDQPIL